MGGGDDNEKYICNGTPFTLKKKLLSVAGYKPGACFTKHLKPKIFLSAIQIVWHLRKS